MTQNSVLNDGILRAQCNFRRAHCAGLFFLGGVYSGEIVRASYEFDARSVYMFIHDMEHNILPHPVPFTAYSSCGTENFPKPRTGDNDNAHFKFQILHYRVDAESVRPCVKNRGLDTLPKRMFRHAMERHKTIKPNHNAYLKKRSLRPNIPNGDDPADNYEASAICER